MTHKRIKPRLLHISSSLKMGGAERVLVDLVSTLRDHYEQEVIFFYDGPHRANLERMGISCRQISGLVCLYDPLFWFRMVRAVRVVRPDCIHSLLWGANWASRVLGRLLGIPVVNGMHNSVDGYGRVRRFLDRLTLTWPDHYVAVSDMVKSSCKRIYPWLPDGRLFIIENGVNLQQTTAERCFRVELGIPADAYVVGTVGRFEPEKNQELLIQAFAAMVKEVSQAYLLLIGYGSQEVHLRNLVAQLGLEKQVVFVIGQPAETYYTVFDCFVLSSPREGLPIALLEAMAHAVVCVVANLDGQQTPLVHGHNGLLARSYDIGALAEVLIGLSNDPSAARRMGIAGKKLVDERYTVARMAASYGIIFDRCVVKKQVRH